MEKGVLGGGGGCPLEANDIYYYLSLNTDTLITFLSFVVIVACLYLSYMSSVMILCEGSILNKFLTFDFDFDFWKYQMKWNHFHHMGP